MPRKLLVISPTPSHPQDSGNRRRIHQLLTQLEQQGVKIHFVLYNVSNSPRLCDAPALREMERAWSEFHYVEADEPSLSFGSRIRRRVLNSRFYRKLATLGFRLPMQYAIDDWCCDRLVSLVSSLLTTETFDYVLVEYVYLSRVLEVVPTSIIRLLDTHDVFANRHQRLLRGGVSPGFFSTSPREEARGLNRADYVLAIQDHESDYLSTQVDLSSTQVLTVPHRESRQFAHTTSKCLTKVGILASNNDINVTSVGQLLREIDNVPKLKDVEFLVAGTVCERIQCKRDNVVLLGPIDDLSSFYRLADLYINPTVAGTGLKIKSVEAISYGVPFLSTGVGMEGLPTNHTFHQFADIRSLVREISSIAADHGSLERYAEASRQCYAKYTTKLDSQTRKLFDTLRLDGDSSVSMCPPDLPTGKRLPTTS